MQLDEPFREELNNPRRTTTTKIEVLLLPFQFLHFLQNFCTHCKALLYSVSEEKWGNPNVNLPFAFTITKYASNEWCQLEKSCALKARAVKRAIQGELNKPRVRISLKRRPFWNYHKLREVISPLEDLEDSFVSRFVELHVSFLATDGSR